ncbi:hypothetical protein SAMN02745164_01512 [Marinitoga hydrogenitolerans DSM 16785]|uniref:DUF4350 domain-containing protein n=1 Tax=Marinitoga hydrogenitolerans (strain DSM 16785 / JCM 12826 / AT1271) TaxID=1122195 RepID=A0A1M4XUI5_MARH1|nr:hypothetical protein [Marinitoga hydrogenitolerans]SHE96933.1 hypothetical protein SAMN02745164_01512 [Marinitoga hydrogenitolerans DSM 16785]
MRKVSCLFFVLIIVLFIFSGCLTKDRIDKFDKIFNNEAILFDNAHSQTAGNADWTIRGGFSDFADDLKNRGANVNEWGNDEYGSNQRDDDSPITYEVISKYKVYVIPEPNIPFTKDEQNAIIKYIKNGGSVFFIADHIVADRNNDGWDAVEIFNGFLKEKHIIETKEIYSDDFVGRLGFRFREKQYSESPIVKIKEHEITKGIKETGAWAGTSEYIIDNENISGIIYYSKETWGAYVISGRYGSGKFVAIGDSSPIDDGTGTSGDKLYDGYYYGDNRELMINIIKWLVE